MGTVFHAGEEAVQDRVGVREEATELGRMMLRPTLSEQLRAFFPTLPFVVAAARDEQGRPWATLLAERPGFVGVPDARGLLIEARPASGDALEAAFTPGAKVGLLGIELETRRRNRVNGTVVSSDGERIALDVDQAFGNCPQYISLRRRTPVDRPRSVPGAVRSDRLDASMRALIETADTLFVASGHRGQGSSAGMDASHRGGAPGFVDVVDDRRLVLPDYAGNRLFNTLGNLESDPRIGLVFVDFERGGLLQLTGRARIEWAPAPSSRHPGAQRLVHIDIEAIVHLDDALPWRWRAGATEKRELLVVDRTRESEDVVSLHLAARDDGPLPPFAAGQYLPVEACSGAARGLVRTYSLSGAPDAGRYRISVRRDPGGTVSRALHDEADIGTAVVAGLPGGDFAVPGGESPVVLIGAGTGMTPLVAMAHDLAGAGREVRMLRVVRDGAHDPFAAEMRALSDVHPALSVMTVFTRPRPEDRLGVDHDVAGRPDEGLLGTLMPDPDAEVRLCGPSGFVSGVTALLVRVGVPSAHIRSESF